MDKYGFCSKCGKALTKKEFFNFKDKCQICYNKYTRVEHWIRFEEEI